MTSEERHQFATGELHHYRTAQDRVPSLTFSRSFGSVGFPFEEGILVWLLVVMGAFVDDCYAG
jgi:hypothetical protein